MENQLQATSLAGRKEYVRITWTDRKDPKMHLCFWAFSDEQFRQGLKEQGLLEAFYRGEVKICSGGAGLYGTKEGLDLYFTDLKEINDATRAEIQEKCTPQDVYEVEYDNYECMYDWDGDIRALGRVLHWFGREEVLAVKRKGYNMDINAAISKLEK